MSEFVVIFAGELIEGQPLEAVKERLAAMFKVTPDKIDHLFSGEWVTIKKGLDHDTASRYDAALHRAGAQVYVMEAGEVADFIAQHTVVVPPPVPDTPPPPPPPPPLVPVIEPPLSTPTIAKTESSADEAALMAAVHAAMAAVEATAAPEPQPPSAPPSDELLDMNQLFGQPTPPPPATPTPPPSRASTTTLTERGVVMKSSPTDLHELEQVEVKSEWSDTLQIHEEIAPPEVDLDGIDLGAVGELLIEPTPFIPIEIDLDHLVCDESGAPLTEPVEVAPLQIDISHIGLQERV